MSIAASDHSQEHGKQKTDIIESQEAFDNERVKELEIKLAEYRRWMARFCEVCEGAAQGNLEPRVLLCDSDQFVRRLANSINNFLDVTDAFVRESGASLEYAAKGKFYRTLVQRGLLGSFRNAAALINSANAEMKNKAEALEHAVQRRFELADSFEGSIKDVVSTIASSATELQATAQSLSITASQTSEQSAAVAAAAEQSSANASILSDATLRLDEAVVQIESKVNESSKATGAAVAEAQKTHKIISGLAEASQRIGGVVKLISQIAEKTNLLALNATIEAARAGEAGKGFAVVASEVKDLARQTAAATDDVTNEITSIQEATGNAVGAVDQIGKTISQIDGISASITDRVDSQKRTTHEIGDNVRQAAIASQEVSQNIAGVTGATRETSYAVEQLLEAAAELSTQAESLTTSVDHFLGEIRRG
ncbi:MAG: hypothetical protein KDD42_02000 [Bdellovibrionales bacterium]|nr:hypothetical protein [Bdellovibrionales bacterium]